MKQLLASSDFKMGSSLVLLTLVVMSPSLAFFASFLDEGIVLCIGERLARGETLYRDIYCYLPPVTPYAYALAFRMLGISLATSQLIYFSIWASQVLLIYFLCRGMAGPRLSALAAIALLVTGANEGYHFNYHWAANLPVITLCIILQCNLEKPGRYLWLCAGAIGGLAGLTLQTFGPVSVALLMVASLEVALRDRKEGLRAFLGWAVGMTIVLGAMGLWLVVSGNISAFYSDVILSNLQRAEFERVTWEQLLVRWGPLAYSSVENLYLRVLLFFGLLSPILFAPSLFRQARFRLIYIAQLLLLAVGVYRFLPTQELMHGIMSIPVLAATFHRGRPREAVGVVGLVYFTLAAWSGWLHWVDVRGALYEVKYPRGIVRVKSREEARSQQALIKLLEDNNPKNSPVFFVPNQPFLGFLMGYPNETRFVQFRPLQFTVEHGKEALAHLGNSIVVRFNIFDSPDFLQASWPNSDIDRYAKEVDWFDQELRRTHDYTHIDDIYNGTTGSIFIPKH